MLSPFNQLGIALSLLSSGVAVVRDKCSAYKN